MTKSQRIAVIRGTHIGSKVTSGNHVAGNSAKAASSTTTQEQKEHTTMAQNPGHKAPPTAPSKPGTVPAQAARPTNGATPTTETAKPSKNKRPRVRWVSTTNPAFWVRSYKDVTDKHGAPRGPNGEEMIAKAGVPFGGARDPGAKQARIAAKEAEKARIAAMSDAEKLAYAKDKREKKQAEQAAKAAAEKAALVAQIRAEINAGKL